MNPKPARRTIAVVATGGLIVSAASMAFLLQRSPSATGGVKAQTAAIVSMKGERVKMKERQAASLHRAGFGPAFLMSIRGESAYYRVEASRGVCYGKGNAASLGTIGLMKCWVAPQPLMELSVVEISRAAPEPRLIEVSGIAADNVAHVVLADANGETVAEEPVIGNVYQFTSIPGGRRIASMRALDSSRVTIYSQVVGWS